MGKHRKAYPAEFRAQMVERVKAGRTPEELAREFEPTAQSIINWVAQADRDSGVRQDGLTTAGRQELTRLRRKVRQLEMERDILSHAAAWFARETGAVPPKGTDS
ncbi:transposase [Burkholderia mayonis]|uniref:Transposase n=1 Tax=Burkholderia mayonis TaxID=1385591 RepID=A0A1B4FD94_9BURK|nr:transposase [Burkholderia mayonis]KVE39944.1 transposase [Burkholderia sp. BDU5]KVE47491.1 transposase [Burkholderia mayonis]